MKVFVFRCTNVINSIQHPLRRRNLTSHIYSSPGRSVTMFKMSLTSCSVLQPCNNASNIRHTFVNLQCNIAQVEVKMFLFFQEEQDKKKETIF